MGRLRDERAESDGGILWHTEALGVHRPEVVLRARVATCASPDRKTERICPLARSGLATLRGELELSAMERKARGRRRFRDSRGPPSLDAGGRDRGELDGPRRRRRGPGGRGSRRARRRRLNGTPLIRPTTRPRGDPRRSSRPPTVPLGGLGDCQRNERLPSTSGRATTCALEGEVEPNPLEVVVLRGTVAAMGGLPKSSPGGGAERTPAGRGCVCPGRVETPQQPRRHGELTINPQTTHQLRHRARGRRGCPDAPQLPFDGCGEPKSKEQGQEEPLCDAS